MASTLDRYMRWTALGRTITQLVNFLVTSVLLMRLLMPSDFGLAAMVTIFTDFLVIFAELGLASAIIQRPELEDRHLDSAFWLSLGSGIALALLTAAAAPLLSAFYGRPALLWMTLSLAPVFVLTAQSSVHRAIIMRDLRQERLIVVEVVSALGGGAGAVAVALAGGGAWSLIVRTAIAAALTTAALWMLSGWRPRARWSAQAARELWQVGGYTMGFSIINYWARQLDDFLIGRLMGERPLGLYNRAYNTMLFPMRHISDMFGRLMFPVMAKVQGDAAQVKALYMASIQLIAAVAFPLMASLGCCAEVFIEAIYGAHWLDMAPMLKVFCAVGMFQCVGTTVGWIYQALGQTALMFRYGLLASVVLMGGIGLGVWYGTPMSVAWGYALGVGLMAAPQLAVPGSLIGVRAAEWAGALWRPLAMAAAAALSALGLASWLPAWLPVGARLAACGVGAASSAWLLMRLMRLRPYMRLRQLIDALPAAPHSG